MTSGLTMTLRHQEAVDELFRRWGVSRERGFRVRFLFGAMPDGDPWAPEHDRALIVGHGRQVRLAVLSARLRSPHPEIVQDALAGLLTEAAQWCDRVVSLERGPYG